ncbi:hypothetical protein [Nonomuraea maritima]|uniref:hypothetical protein n=1 Tax=Nonomuraea maritima TaxID=683260 RepID=UPI003715A73B
MPVTADGLRLLGAVALGALTAVLELAFLLLPLPFLGNPNVAAAARPLPHVLSGIDSHSRAARLAAPVRR